MAGGRKQGEPAWGSWEFLRKETKGKGSSSQPGSGVGPQGLTVSWEKQNRKMCQTSSAFTSVTTNNEYFLSYLKFKAVS